MTLANEQGRSSHGADAPWRNGPKRMGFDIVPVRSRLRDETVDGTNPFTGEVTSVRIAEFRDLVRCS